jgi:DNA mismatch repair protein MSH6
MTIIDELLPQEGKDEEYDTIMEEIKGLEESLEEELQKLQAKLG